MGVSVMGRGKCRGCDQDILWARTTSKGAKVPLNATPEKRFVSCGGDYVALVDTWQSHFVTCVKAEEFRKGRTE